MLYLDTIKRVKMKNILLVSLVALVALNSSAQEKVKTYEKGFELTITKDLEKSSVGNQYKSSTCWSFSSNSFFESEVLRLGNEPVDLAEMFIVWNTYMDKAIRYVRMHGETNFGPGGAFHDMSYVARNYGLMPELAYPGLLKGEEKPVHFEMDNMLKAMVDVVVKNPNKKLSSAWEGAIAGTLDSYLGEKPEKFSYNGKEYTSQEFAESIGINFDDYVEIGSYSHHPFYEEFIIEIPDNWMNDKIYNVPLEDLKNIMKNAVENGYSFAWGADVSEKGFSWKHGVAVVPENDWNEDERKIQDSLLSMPITNKVITQEYRQQKFDNYETQDDHGMHITGMAKDEKGNKYYTIKNSWGETNDAKGYGYASESYMLLKTIDIMVHKDAVPKEIRKKLGF